MISVHPTSKIYPRVWKGVFALSRDAVQARTPRFE
jgi:hypothetical protein